MPKDPARNIDRYQMDGDHLNEFEFEKNQEAIKRDERDHFTRKEEERALSEREAEQARESEAERNESLTAQVRGESEGNSVPEEKSSATSGA